MLAAIFLASSSAWAGEALKWEDAVREALGHHPELAVAREAVNRAKADRTTAASSFWPSVSLSAGGGTSETRTAGSSARDSFSYGISGRQLLFNGFKNVYEARSAVESVNAAEYSYSVKSSETRLNLRRAYVNLWRAQELIGISERILDRRQESMELIRLRYEAGREHRGSLLTAEANLAQAQFELERARRDRDVAQRGLIKELGREQFEPILVLDPSSGATGGSDPLSAANDLKPDFELLAAEHPFLLQLTVLKEAALWGVRSAQADFFPSVYADASLGKQGTSWAPDTTDWSAGASASVTVFDGWNLAAGVDRAAAARRSAEAALRSGRDGVLFTLEDAWAGWKDAEGDVAVQQKFLEAARERAQIAKAEYGTGLIGFNDWIIIENNLVQADKAALDARASVLIAEALWRQAKGETLDE